MDIQQKRAQILQLRRGDGRAADAAPALAVRQKTALQDQFAVALQFVFAQPAVGAVRLKDGGDHAFLRAGADQLPTGSAADGRAQRVDDDGLARAGLAGEDVQPRTQSEVRLFDHGYIFDMQLCQHRFFLLGRNHSILLISRHKCSADVLLVMVLGRSLPFTLSLILWLKSYSGLMRPTVLR